MLCKKHALVLVLFYSLVTNADQTIQFSSGKYVGQQDAYPPLIDINLIGSGTGFAVSAQFTPAVPAPVLSLHFSDRWVYNIPDVVSNQVYNYTVNWSGPASFTVILGSNLPSPINVTGVSLQLLGTDAQVAGDSLQANPGFAQSVVSSMGREEFPVVSVLGFLSVPGANSCCFQPEYGFDGVLTFSARFFDGNTFQGYEYKNVTSMTKICAPMPEPVPDFQCEISAMNFYLNASAPITSLLVWAESDAVTETGAATDSNVGTDSANGDEDDPGLSLALQITLGCLAGIVFLAIVVVLVVAAFIVWKKKRTQYSPLN